MEKYASVSLAVPIVFDEGSECFFNLRGKIAMTQKEAIERGVSKKGKQKIQILSSKMFSLLFGAFLKWAKVRDKTAMHKKANNFFQIKFTNIHHMTSDKIFFHQKSF